VPNKTESPEIMVSVSKPLIAEKPNPISGNQGPTKPESPKNILSVEHAPVFPGCDASASNAEKVDCMSSKINAFILRKFDSDKFNYLEGLQRITVQFKINSNGEITDVKALAKDKDLAKEAKRVIEKLPIMKPGKMGDTNVDVLYSIPILFQIQE
jgi:protein TonB